MDDREEERKAEHLIISQHLKKALMAQGEEHMSSVHAVTEDIVIIAKVASFYPIDYKKLNREFADWLASKQQDYKMIVYNTKIDIKGKNGG